MVLPILALILSAPAYSQISGVILADPDGNPVARAEVSLETTIGGKRHTALAYSNGSGAFRFEGLPVGRYLLAIRRSGFASPRNKVLTLKPGSSFEDASYRLSRTGSVSGKVTTPEGAALPMAIVQLLRPVYHRGRLYWTQATSATTDDRGEYRMHGVMPGSYRLRASTLSVLRLSPFNTELKTLRGLPRFYPGSENASGAGAVAVPSGQEVRGVDIALPLEQPALLRVHVTGKPEGADVPLVQLIPENGMFQDSNAAVGVRVPAEDTFEIRDILPGNYHLLARWKSHTAQTLLTVRGDGDLSVALAPPVEVAGDVRFEGGIDVPKGVFRVKIASAGRFAMPPLDAPVTGENHRFVLRDVPVGAWDVGVEPMPAGSYIKSVTFGGKDVLVDDMVITPVNRGPLRIVVSAKGARVEGAVNGEEGYVLLAPWGSRREAWGFYHMVEIKAGGQFEIRGIAPGEYRVFAVEELAEGAATQHTALLDRLAEWGVPVTLEEGGSASVQVRMIPSALWRLE